MTTPSERRLHPASPVFVLLLSLRQFALPIVVLLFTGRGDRTELVSLVAVGALVLHSLARYWTYRYRLERDEIVIRSGVLKKSVRHIPFARIQNVSLRQSLLHRAFRVAEVELESAGGRSAEGQMRVLSLADAHELEATVRGHERAQHAVEGGEAPAPPSRVLLTLDTDDLIRLGFVSNRGLVLIAAALGVISQTGSEVMAEFLTRWTRALMGWSETLHLSTAGAVLSGVVLVVILLALLYLLSAVLSISRYHAFTLTDDGRRLRVERGLFTRVRGALLRRRIQAFTLHESLMHRWLRRRSLTVDSAAMPMSEERSLSELAPIATREQMDALLGDLLSPTAAWPVTEWHPLHPRAWRRVFGRAFAWTLVLTAIVVNFAGPWGLLVLAMTPLLVLRARQWARHAGWSDAQGLIAVREGWLSRGWRFAEVRKLQVLTLTQTPFDRRHGMASLWMDTAGAVRSRRPLRIRFLPEADARALHARLAAVMRG